MGFFFLLFWFFAEIVSNQHFIPDVCGNEKSCIFVTLYVLICGCRAWPRANTLLYTSHPTSCGDFITWYNLPSVGFQRSFYPFCECLSGPHRVSDSCFIGFYIFRRDKCIPLIIFCKGFFALVLLRLSSSLYCFKRLGLSLKSLTILPQVHFVVF